jgi:uncharacterized protein YbbC (DUF1343 family)
MVDRKRPSRKKVLTGLEVFVESPPSWGQGRRIGLLCNQASVDGSLNHAKDRIASSLSGGLTCLFSPQHGLYSEKQDNMMESPDERDPELDLPVHSLYGRDREPSDRQLSGIDLLLIDLQDVGCRVYTFIWTMYLAMKACARAGVAVGVLDRPNPLGGETTEGNLLAADCESFVGLAPIPMRHGMTVGELARFFLREQQLDLELHVVPMQGWERSMPFEDTGLPWVWPSPNMPTPGTARVYPGQVLWEGTNVSEGRGTTKPFELFGAPYFDCTALAREMEKGRLPGFVLRVQRFEPTFQKWAGRRCEGFEIHVDDPARYRPYLTSLVLLSLAKKLHPQDFAWREPPYEYEFERLPADLIIGDKRVRTAVEAGVGPAELQSIWEDDLQEFNEQRRAFLLYD